MHSTHKKETCGKISDATKKELQIPIEVIKSCIQYMY